MVTYLIYIINIMILHTAIILYHIIKNLYYFFLLKVELLPLTNSSVCCYCHPSDTTYSGSINFYCKEHDKIILHKNLQTYSNTEVEHMCNKCNCKNFRISPFKRCLRKAFPNIKVAYNYSCSVRLVKV